MKSKKQLQLGEMIKRAMSEIFLRSDVLSLKGSYITILEADASPDLKNVRIFIDIFGNEAAHEKIIERLNGVAPHFRFELAKKLAVRVVPEISFILDKTQANVQKIESLLGSDKKVLVENAFKK
jgi:ribosome-binding factor A